MNLLEDEQDLPDENLSMQSRRQQNIVAKNHKYVSVVNPIFPSQLPIEQPVLIMIWPTMIRNQYVV